MARLLLLLLLLFSSTCGSQDKLPPGSLGDCKDGAPCDGEPGCLEGSLCPEGPAAPCPPGAYLSPEDPGGSSLCRPCPPGFFNRWPDQPSCFPCGSEAVQPEAGRDTCVCRGQGRVFQPSDGHCACGLGFREEGGSRGCVRTEREPCRAGATRNQEGQCLTASQWADHCAHEVCTEAGDAHGHDPVLGICLCRAEGQEDPRDLWGWQRRRPGLKLTCRDGVPWVSAVHADGSQMSLAAGSPAPRRGVGHPCGSPAARTPASLFLLRTDARGFQGLSGPGPDLLRMLRPPPHRAAASPGAAEPPPPPPALSALRNPTACIRANDSLAFLLSRRHYPQYDAPHPYNTRGDFDWGAFRALAQETWLSPGGPALFLHQFSQPGVFVLRLSSNPHRKMYIRALPLGGRCPWDGSFVPTTPGHLVQMGIARPLEPRPKPDWPAVVGTSAGLLGLCLLPPLLGRRLGCARKAPPHPAFRRLQRGYRLDTYCSPRAPVTCVKRERPDRDPPPPDGPGRSGRTPEPEDRLDLAGFDTDAFFGVLLGQTRSVTASLGRAEDELRLLFLELEKETKALRRLWGSRRPDPATAERQAPEEARPGGGGRQPGRTQTARGVSGHTEKSGERSQLEE